MIILRIRTNVGVFRVEILNQSVTIEELKQKIILSLHILEVKSSNLLLSLDLENTKTLSHDWNHRTISDVCSTFNCSSNGMLLYIVGKFEKVEVVKPYIDGDGLLVKEGTMLKKLDSESSEEIKDGMQDQKKIELKEEVEKTDVKMLETTTVNSNSFYAEKYESNKTNASDVYAPSINDFYDDEIRAPDESKNMKLIDEFQYSNSAALSKTVF